jgi:hypothetical protein
MGERPKDHSIDRFPNNKGDYEPGNCRWATQTEQIANSEQRRGLENHGRKDADEIRSRMKAGEHYKDLADEFGRSQVAIHRIASGKTYSQTREPTQDEMSAALAAVNAMRSRRQTK